ncbi:5-aminovalerate aminotransferase DavT [Planctomycetes bacterium Pan216]|uniref:5-aminovalerate aminotransferase DavT n=1 Tax=Kolteria novifilia TaxID=2527975 RepID=A0A518B6L4_9BACT|nr:5-aminovalerate aminotransferase DavT [Planctomycetes bacterium Pan216]
MITTMNDNHLSSTWARLCNETIVRGSGPYVYGETGSRYLDFTSGIGVTNTGHCHPVVVKAIQEQAERMLFGQLNCMITEQALRYSEELSEVTPGKLDTFFFSNSGSEAVEGAVKLARMATHRPNIIAFQGGFHGRTAMTMALTSSKIIYRAGYQPLPAGVFFAPFPNAYQWGWDEERSVSFCLDEFDRMLKTQTAPSETAAVLIEPVLGEGGYVPTPLAFLEGLRQRCDDHGILLITDEVQSGFGRTGSFWAHSRAEVTPDILVMAKGIASGMPMSAIAASRDLMNFWPKGAHGGTYGGGNPVVLAAARATLTAIQEEKLVENARVMGDYLLSKLRGLQHEFPIIGDVRGWGLMVATEFTHAGRPAADVTKRIQQYCLDHKLLLLTSSADGNVIRWIPPLIVTHDHLDEALAIFADALGEVS